MQISLDIPKSSSKTEEYYKLLPMCDEDYRETITDMFNPIYIGYQLFKRGFCLAYNNGDLNKVKKRTYPKLSDDNFSELIKPTNPDPSAIEPTSWNNTIIYKVSNVSNELFTPISNNTTITLPILSPNGLCIDNLYPKKENLEKNWWYAPGPRFIKLPRNVMYPFRIGPAIKYIFCFNYIIIYNKWNNLNNITVIL